MTKIDYNRRQHSRYHEGRALEESALDLWRMALRRFVGDRGGMTILDLGSGTGRFSPLLADAFDSQVVGVEPSDKMRAVAEAECQHPRVRFLAGAAEHIPMPDGSCDLAWMSQVIHHLPDFDAAARELARVIKPSGLLFVRNNFKGRLDGCCLYYKYFPAGLVADEARHPTVESIEENFAPHGFGRVAFEMIKQMEARSLREYAQRVGLRPYSTFELISDEEFEAGLAALQAAAAQEQAPQPVMGTVDLLVLRRT